MRRPLTSRHLLVLLGSLVLSACGGIGRPRVIYLARHGQTEWNRVQRLQGNPDLDPVGYVNRAGLWLLLKDEPLAAIYTSAAKRTRRTAELLARQHKLAIEARPSLNEIQPGVLEGFCVSQLAGHTDACSVAARGTRPDATLAALRDMARAVHESNGSMRAPLGENFDDLRARTATFVEELERGSKDRSILIVGHGVTNRVLLHHLMGWSMDAVARLRQENDQVYKIEQTEGTTKLSMYTPGLGWRVCKDTPQPGQKQLDCNPGPPGATEWKKAPPPPPPPPAPPAPPSP